MTESEKLSPAKVLAVCRDRIRKAIIALLRGGAPEWQVREALRGAEADWENIKIEVKSTCVLCNRPMTEDEIYHAHCREDGLCDPCFQGPANV